MQMPTGLFMRTGQTTMSTSKTQPCEERVTPARTPPQTTRGSSARGSSAGACGCPTPRSSRWTRRSVSTAARCSPLTCGPSLIGVGLGLCTGPGWASGRPRARRVRWGRRTAPQRAWAPTSRRGTGAKPSQRQRSRPRMSQVNQEVTRTKRSPGWRRCPLHLGGASSSSTLSWGEGPSRPSIKVLTPTPGSKWHGVNSRWVHCSFKSNVR